jgi:hypothetical protein
MKEVLAKSFLKDPDHYLARLKAKERAQVLAKERAQTLAKARSKLPEERDVRFRPDQPVNPRPNHPVNPRPSGRPLQNSDLKFDKNFPWNPNSYDDSGRRFKGGYVYNKESLNYDLDHVKQVHTYICLYSIYVYVCTYNKLFKLTSFDTRIQA